MHPDLVKLLTLQGRDVALLEADRGLDQVLAELEALDQQLADAERAVAEAGRAVAEATRRRKESEAKLEHYKKLEERGKARLDQIRTPKELQAVNAELDLTRSVMGKEEADWLKLSDLVTAAELAAKEAEARRTALGESQEATRAEIDGRRKAAEAVRDQARAERDAAADDVTRPLRTRYERLRTVKSVSVVVALSGASCGACFTQVPLNRRTQIRAGTLIDSCESCGVILYAEEEPDA